MPFPPHLFKPVDSIDLYLTQTDDIVIGVTQNWFIYTPSPGIIAIIKEISNTDTINEVWAYYFKNNILLFSHGQAVSPLIEIKQPNHFFEYLRENPILLTENDTLRIDVVNNTAGLQNFNFKAFGYTYPVWRQDEKKESLLR